ncbi:Spherulation-specific family 4-domain-containing protein [Fusarium redolens]|uniref:Spherulation-specific family 4-domain-containing protein n=1 Tax=Fusarium redolens TaxID=48865 RepID=A0A9P9GLG3_FUSRE|nr:Spherulation-specific family 4-domain-containing protein [Fusarium redolens]KAH7240710.1 Spherulation-specific family 4-domain-containing protein [Fusarium redolens]
MVAPEWVTKAFHPKTAGLTEVRNQILEAWGRDPPENPNGGGGDGGGQDGVNGTQITIASYINPIADPGAWDRLIGYLSSKLSVLVASVVNGPDSKVDSDWKKVIERAAASGKTIIGYVRTGYLRVSHQKFKTRLGSLELADWTAQIEEDVDAWYSLYGSSIGGIFFDEGWNDCGPNNIYANLYIHIDRHTKAKHPGAFTVLNSGATMPSCFERTMDTLMTFERSYEDYLSDYQSNGWPVSDTRKLWHIVYRVPESAVSHVAQLARERGATLLEMTDDDVENPYDNLPADSYMLSSLAAVSGGRPLREKKSFRSGSGASTPGSLTFTKSDYSSAHLKWSAALNAIGYTVYRGGQFVASVPASMTEVTVGGLEPGSSTTFSVAAIGGGGTESSQSNSATASTQSLPNGKTIINYSSSPSGGSAIIKADVLVPYVFHGMRWPVNTKVDAYVCTKYMVEGTKFFKYNGKTPPGFTSAPWAWEKIAEDINADISGYTCTWTLPIGTSKIDTKKFSWTHFKCLFAGP